MIAKGKPLRARRGDSIAPASGRSCDQSRDSPMCTSRWGGDGRVGDWQKELVTGEGLKEQGWREGAAFDDPSTTGWVLFTRQCKQGKSFTYRTDKYSPAVLPPS